MVKIPKKFERWVSRELENVKSNLVMRNSDSDYEVFGKFRILCRPNEVRVYQRQGLLGTFSSKKIALSWCTANKFRMFELASRILSTDTRLQSLKNDVRTRLNIAERAKQPQFRENILCKIETKIIIQKQLEKHLKECADLAKYYQQRGFNNETARAR